MEDKRELSAILDVQLFMKMVEPELETLLRTFYELKKNADAKRETNEIILKLERQFDLITRTINDYSSTNQHICNLLNSIGDFSKRDEIRTTNMVSRKISTDFFDLMKATDKGFEYGYWGTMNKRIQQCYLRIYSYYSKCIYELIKKSVTVNA